MNREEILLPLYSKTFQTETEFIKFMTEVANQTLENCLTDFHTQNSGRGYQTTTKTDLRYGFVIKTLLPHGDRRKEESIKDFKVAQKCGRGIITPFFFLKRDGEINALVAKKVDVVDDKYIRMEDKRFVDNLLNLYEQSIKQGFFDCDLIIGNYGRDASKLVNLDFGWSKDLWDEETFAPAQDLHWDAFHMGVHKFRETADELNRITSGLGNYFLKQVQSKYGINFDKTTLSCPRRSHHFVPLAEKLRQYARKNRGENQKPVYPLVGEPIDTAIYSALENRMLKN